MIVDGSDRTNGSGNVTATGVQYNEWCPFDRSIRE
jgi:hypothetical protein